MWDARGHYVADPNRKAFGELDPVARLTVTGDARSIVTAFLSALPDDDGLVERLRANADPRCHQHIRELSAQAADTITRLLCELRVAREAKR